MSIDEIHNHKILELIQSNRCDLSNANISELDTNILNYQNIEELILSENKITVLPKSIGKLSNLKWLVLSDNLLLKIPSSICKLVNLEGLFLSGNNLSKIPKNIINLKKLRWLALSENENLVLDNAQEQWIEDLRLNGCKVLYSEKGEHYLARE